MARTATGLTVDEYLDGHHTISKPESELIGGELVQKPMGTLEHSRMYLKIVDALRKRVGPDQQILIEISVRLGEDVCIPDVAVAAYSAQLYRNILNEPPFLCVEILSPSQSWAKMFTKCELYHRNGVPYCWVIDPERKIAFEYHQDGTCEIPTRVTDAVQAGEIRVRTDELFA